VDQCLHEFDKKWVVLKDLTVSTPYGGAIIEGPVPADKLSTVIVWEYRKMLDKLVRQVNFTPGFTTMYDILGQTEGQGLICLF